MFGDLSDLIASNSHLLVRPISPEVFSFPGIGFIPGSPTESLSSDWDLDTVPGPAASSQIQPLVRFDSVASRARAVSSFPKLPTMASTTADASYEKLKEKSMTQLGNISVLLRDAIAAALPGGYRSAYIAA
jgi:hypothetical protein